MECFWQCRDLLGLNIDQRTTFTGVVTFQLHTQCGERLTRAMLRSYAAHHMEIIIGITWWFRATTLKYTFIYSHLKTKKGYDESTYYSFFTLMQLVTSHFVWPLSGQFKSPTCHINYVVNKCWFLCDMKTLVDWRYLLNGKIMFQKDWWNHGWLA